MTVLKALFATEPELAAGACDLDLLIRIDDEKHCQVLDYCK
jgi:hypothetical protein